MNYRHAYHAGNFADVFKHVLLARVIEHAKLKPGPFRFLDTHAGTGRYDLEATQAVKTGEWRDGIGRLIGPGTPPLPESAARLLAPYLDVVRSENPAGELRYYPGSSLVARRLLRPQDRIVATELHPQDCTLLARRFSRDRQVKVVELDGWLALKSCLPPVERRGIVLVDPPFEARDEFDRMVTGISEALRRFATGCYLLWYPIKDPAVPAAFHERLRRTGVANGLFVELLIRRPSDPRLLNGCGLLILNAPWTLTAELEIILPALAERLAAGEGRGYRLSRLDQ